MTIELLAYIKLLEDAGGDGGGDSVPTNTVGDGTGAVKLYAPPLTKHIAKHGLLEDGTPAPMGTVTIPTSPDAQPKEIYDFLVAQKKANDPEDG
jgi:hypothetical protein